MLPEINENIWEIHVWPRCGENFDFYLINDIYFYNSLTNHFEDGKQSIYIQIPESLLVGEKDFISQVIEKKNYIVENRIPILRKIDEENWAVDLKFLREKIGKL